MTKKFLSQTVSLFCSHTEIDDMIRKSTNLLLTRTLSGCLSSLIKKPNLSLLQVWGCYQLGKSGTIRESNEASGLSKAHYA